MKLWRGEGGRDGNIGTFSLSVLSLFLTTTKLACCFLTWSKRMRFARGGVATTFTLSGTRFTARRMYRNGRPLAPPVATPTLMTTSPFATPRNAPSFTVTCTATKLHEGEEERERERERKGESV